MMSPDQHISIHAGSTCLLHSEVDGSDYFTGIRVGASVSHVQAYTNPFRMTLIQQQGYQHAVHVNLCLVIYEDLTLL